MKLNAIMYSAQYTIVSYIAWTFKLWQLVDLNWDIKQNKPLGMCFLEVGKDWNTPLLNKCISGPKSQML